jgi:hypothetical protein
MKGGNHEISPLLSSAVESRDRISGRKEADGKTRRA